MSENREYDSDSDSDIEIIYIQVSSDQPSEEASPPNSPIFEEVRKKILILARFEPTTFVLLGRRATTELRRLVRKNLIGDLFKLQFDVPDEEVATLTSRQSKAFAFEALEPHRPPAPIPWEGPLVREHMRPHPDGQTIHEHEFMGQLGVILGVIRQLLTCLLCKQLVTSGVQLIMCRMGHFLCSSCEKSWWSAQKRRVPQCSFCRQPAIALNKTAENLSRHIPIYVPCIHPNCPTTGDIRSMVRNQFKSVSQLVFGILAKLSILDHKTKSFFQSFHIEVSCPYKLFKCKGQLQNPDCQRDMNLPEVMNHYYTKFCGTVMMAFRRQDDKVEVEFDVHLTDFDELNQINGVVNMGPIR